MELSIFGSAAGIHVEGGDRCIYVSVLGTLDDLSMDTRTAGSTSDRSGNIVVNTNNETINGLTVNGMHKNVTV